MTDSATGVRSDSTTALTRLLCAGAYLDAHFRRETIRTLLESPRRALAPAPDVNLAAVLKHALIAQRRATLVSVGLMLLAAGLVVCVVEADELIGLFWGLLAAAVGLIGWDRWHLYHRVLAQRLSVRHFEEDPAGYSVSSRIGQAIEYLESFMEGNVLVSGGYSPFPGAGKEIGGWSYVLDVQKGKEDPINGRFTPSRVSVGAVYERASLLLERLGMPCLDVSDILCVDGEAILGDSRFVPHQFERPVRSVPVGVAAQCAESDPHRFRLYRRIRVCDWSGELVLSMFFRLHLQGGKLLVEARYYVLEPLKEQYHAVDALTPSLTLLEALRFVGRVLRGALPLILNAPREVGALLIHPVLVRDRYEQEALQIQQSRFFNYGALPSVRELGAGAYRRHAQQLDEDLDHKMIERVVLDSLLQVMDEANVDTSELRERSTTILNNGVIVSGGGRVGAVALGARATAAVRKVFRREARIS